MSEFIVVAMVSLILITACNSKPREQCPKPKIQIADMTNQYKECKGIEYDR